METRRMNGNRIMALAVVGLMIASGFTILTPSFALAGYPIGDVPVTMSFGTPHEFVSNGKFNGPATSMTRTSDGHYLTFVREGATHVGAGDYGIMKLYSSSDGTVWTYSSTLVNVYHRDVRNYAAGTTQTGRIYVFYAAYDCDNATWVGSFPHYISSSDNGATWSASSELSCPSIDGFMPTSASVHGELRGIGASRIGMTIYAGNISGTHLRYVYSDDDGTTWSQMDISGFYALPGIITEADIAYAGGSNLIVVARIDAPINETRMFTSADAGATWSDRGVFSADQFAISPHPYHEWYWPPSLTVFTDQIGQPWVLLILAMSNILFTYASADVLMAQGVSAWPPFIAPIPDVAPWLDYGLYATGVFDSSGHGVLTYSHQTTSMNETMVSLEMTAIRHYSSEQLQLIGLINITFMFMILGVAVAPIMYTVKISSQTKKLPSVKDIINMSVYTIVGLTLIGVIWAAVG